MLRRIRRVADCSQRELAERVGISETAVAAAENGTRDVPATVLARAVTSIGGRLVDIDASGAELVPMDEHTVRDGAGRLLPAHLDTRHGDEHWWGGPHRPGLRPPRCTYDLDRRARDGRRSRRRETPADHHRPQAGDALPERAAARRAARAAAAVQEHRRRSQAGGLPPAPPDPECSCPAACDALLDTPVPAPHTVECRCRCDVG